MEASSRHAIPSPHDDDDEDVSWALSTASALWASGDRSEALKWLRRAAETASDNNADTRALELFKAAAEVATTMASVPPGPPDGPRSGSAAPPASGGARGQARSPSTAPSAGSAAPAAQPRASAAPPAAGSRPSGAPPPEPSQRITALPDTMAQPTTRDPVPTAPRSQHPRSPIAVAPSRKSEPASHDMMPRKPASSGAPSGMVPSTMRTDAPPSGALPAPAPMPSEVSSRSRSAPAARVSTAARVRARPLAFDRRPVDDEVTVQKDVSHLAGLGAPAPPPYDDLDEETNVIPGAPALKSRPPASRRDEDGAGELDSRLTEMSPPLSDEDTAGATGVDSGADGSTPTDTPPPDKTQVWAIPPAIQQALPRGAEARAPSRPAAIPAVRVAVLGTDAEGEVRLVALAPGTQAPTGAPVAILVPVSEEDGEAIARLFGSS